MAISITLIIVIITCLVSYLCFQNREWFGRLQFNAYQVVYRKEYYRLITHGFVHANWMHLIINMFVFYNFGEYVEQYYGWQAVGGIGAYVAMYLLAIPLSSLLSLKYKDNPYYNAVGASGAVNAVLFSFVFLNPWAKLYLFFAIPIPGILFGVLYLWYSYAMSKKENDGIGHDAHFLGAVVGVAFTAMLIPNSTANFIQKLFEF